MRTGPGVTHLFNGLMDAKKAARCKIGSRPSPGVQSMKAIRMHTQGGPDSPAYEDAPKPALQPGDARPRHRHVDNEDRLTWDES